jgi:mannose-6-phosphate isomerase-like protein (cupin superfamily)
LMHPDVHRNRRQSLAEATVAVGEQTIPHKHPNTEELYHITGGSGLIFVGDDQQPVSVGDTVLIAPGVIHSIRNTGDTELVILCACSPPYSHEDTIIVPRK